MMGGDVLALFGPAEREDCLYALSKAVLRIQANGTPFTEIARKINASTDTVEAAAHGHSLLTFDKVARLAHHFPAEFAIVAPLFSPAPTGPLTVADRLERIERELDAIRREAA